MNDNKDNEAIEIIKKVVHGEMPISVRHTRDDCPNPLDNDHRHYFIFKCNGCGKEMKMFEGKREINED